MTLTVIVGGLASGTVLNLDEPVSFWGGVSPESGVIIEPGHPQFGRSVSGKILGMPHGRGSSSSSSVLAELLRIGAGPAGIILDEPDSILMIGVLVAQLLYGSVCPIVIGESPPSGVEATIEGDQLHVGPNQSL
jgi:predicted aconitase with swiveling domain